MGTKAVDSVVTKSSLLALPGASCQPGAKGLNLPAPRSTLNVKWG